MPEKLRKRTSGAVVLIATCEICGKMAHHGFAKLWACAEHLEQVERMWQELGAPAK